MPPFTSLFTKVLDVPGDPDQTITIRMLAPESLEQAAKLQQRKVMQDVRDMGGMAILKEFEDLKATGADARAADPLLQFDRVTLLEKGIMGWTYEPKVSRVTCADLTEDVAEFVARAILRLAKPSLFVTAEEAEAEKKDAAAPSIVH